MNLLAYTANAPRSVHRGVEVGLDWRPLPALLPGAKLQASYSYNDHHYTEFQERLTAGTVSRLFDRAGRAIPGVIPTFVNARLGYDQPAGPLQGLGGFVELSYREGYPIDNANLLTVPDYTLANLNLHYDPPGGAGDTGSRISLFASVQNLFDRAYVGSASIIANGIAAATGVQNGVAVLRTTTGSIYAGQPRTVYAGIRTRF